MFKILREHKILAVLAIIILVGAILVQPVVIYGHDDGSSDSGGCSSGDESTTDHSGSSESGKGHYGRGSGGHGGRHSDVTETEEEEEGSGGNQDKKGGGGSKKPITRGSGNGGKKDTLGGEITLVVTVTGLPMDLETVDVTLTREDVSTTLPVGLENGEGTVTFESEASGDCFLKGEDVPGYITPSTAISLTGDVKEVTETLTYVPSNIPVTGVSIETKDPELDMENLQIIAGYSDLQLVAKIIPGNANIQEVTWESSDENVATVSDYGLVEGVSEGPVEITVTTDEGGFTDTCQITAFEIVDLPDLQVDAVRNEMVNLPKTISVELNNGTFEDVSVAWEDEYGNELGDIFQVPEVDPLDSYTFYGYVDGAPELSTLIINVDKLADPAILVEGISLDVNSQTLIQGDNFTLVSTIEPLNATNQSVIWTTSKESVAIVNENGTVYGVSPGTTTITAESVDGGYKAYCIVTVVLEAEVSYIYPTLADGAFGEHFDELGVVYINVANLITKLNEDYKSINQEFPATGLEYHVKVEDNIGILGEGVVTVFGNEEDAADIYGTPNVEYFKLVDGTPVEEISEFNLYDVTNFKATESYNNRYFVSMSQDPSYPKDDEKTLYTNFNVGGTTPTFPVENVEVTVEITEEYNSGNPDGIIFLLCRELDEEASETTWQDYYDGPGIPPENPYASEHVIDRFNDFTDEVKMTGIVENGKVKWDTPRETLKLGGYYLLEVTPRGYLDNLNDPNTESDDGELLKVVNLVRNGFIIRHVTNIYI